MRLPGIHDAGASDWAHWSLASCQGVAVNREGVDLLEQQSSLSSTMILQDGVEEERQLVPARMLNEFTYCPRLAYLEWVEGEFADNFYTEDGRHRHRRVDKGEGQMPYPEEWEDGERKLQIRSVMMSGVSEGIIARIDMVEVREGTAAPIDYKRGRKPDIPGGAWDPERVQVGAQGLILRENGWNVEGGWLYYVESRERVWISLDGDLEARVREARTGLLEAASKPDRPAPLQGSPKCDGCSLAGICLPDEVVFLSYQAEYEAVEAEEALPAGEVPEEGRKPRGAEVRRLVAARDEALPLYVQTQGMYLGLSGEVLQVRKRQEVVDEVRLMDVSQVNLLGNIQVSTQTVRELCWRGIPLCYFSMGGWFYGLTSGMMHKNVLLRQRQYAAAADPERCLEIARSIVSSKILNCRTLLRRNHSGLPREDRVEFMRLARAARGAGTLESLLGIEGQAGRLYFGQFAGMLKQGGLSFDFHGRNRRPPRDPVNALLSYAYSLLTKEWTVVLQAVGWDPYMGWYHQPRYGRPSLALDMMEEFRPVIADSCVIWALNNGVVTPSDFERAANAVTLTPAGRKAFLEAYERRLDELVTHPTFGYRVSYRRLLEVQARLVARYLDGEIARFPTFRVR